MAKRGRRNKTEPLASEITKLWQQGKSDDDILWELKEKLPCLMKQGKVRDIEDLPSLYSIAQYRREKLEENDKRMRESGLDQLWTLSALSANPISAECISKILWLKKNNELEIFTDLTIREVLWFEKLHKLPLPLTIIATFSKELAEAEILSSLANIQVDTSPIEQGIITALRHTDADFDQFATEKELTEEQLQSGLEELQKGLNEMSEEFVDWIKSNPLDKYDSKYIGERFKGCDTVETIRQAMLGIFLAERQAQRLIDNGIIRFKNGVNNEDK